MVHVIKFLNCNMYMFNDLLVRYRQRFYDQVGHKTMYASSGNKHFSLNLVIVTYQTYEL